MELWPRTKAAWKFWMSMRRFGRLAKLSDRLLGEAKATDDRELILAVCVYIAAQGRYLDRLVRRDRGLEIPLEERIRLASKPSPNTGS